MSAVKSNKGFSLVELVIVIAIMAIIVSVLAPQFLIYVEKSRQGKDVDVVGVVHRAISAAMADTAVDDRPIGGYGGAGAPKYLQDIEDGSMPKFASEIATSIGVSDLTTFAANAFTSNAFRGAQIQVEIDSTSQHVTVTVLSNVPGIDDIVVQ